MRREGRLPMHHRNRPGRSENDRKAVLEAADDLVVESGLATVTMEGIAVRAEVAQQTIRRWWSSTVDILLETVATGMAQHLCPPDQRDLASDLRVHLSRVAHFLTGSGSGAVFRALAGQAQHEPWLAARLRLDCLGLQRRRDRVPLQRAIERGQLPADLDLDIAVDQLVGPIYYRVLIGGQPVSRAFTDGLVHQFLAQHDRNDSMRREDRDATLRAMLPG